MGVEQVAHHPDTSESVSPVIEQAVHPAKATVSKTKSEVSHVEMIVIVKVLVAEGPEPEGVWWL